MLKKNAIYFSCIAVIICVVLFCNFLCNILTPTVKNGEIEVHFLDVDQGDCTLVRSEDKNMLIDAGLTTESDMVISYLESLGIEKLDIVVASHPHNDHIGSMDDVLLRFDAGVILMPDVSNETIAYDDFIKSIGETDVLHPKGGDDFDFSDAKIKVIAPNLSEYKNLNNYSIGFILYHGDNSFLFMGDAEGKSQREIMKKDYDLDCDVYKVAHHGGKSSFVEKFIDKVSPEISVISAGVFNEYSLPDDVVTDYLSKYGEIYRTDLDGTVVITSDGKDLFVKSDRR